jgi:hypothetical protein
VNLKIRATDDTASRARWAIGKNSVIALLLVMALLALQPLAQATPPDPTWIPGLWDDADYDDVVLVVTGAVVVAESFFADPVGPIVSCLCPVASGRCKIVAAGPLESSCSRAPPQQLS